MVNNKPATGSTPECEIAISPSSNVEPASNIPADEKQKRRGRRPNRNINSFKHKSSTAVPSRAAKHEAGNSFIDEYERFHDARILLDEIDRGQRELSTEETASDALSSMNSTISSEFGRYEVIEYDLNDPNDFHEMSFNFGNIELNSNGYNQRSEKNDKKDVSHGLENGKLAMKFPELDLVIEDNSPAAEALRANANVHVSTAGKAARAVHLQSIRRLAKFAAGANKTGYVKGKPPRVPPASQKLAQHRVADGPFGGPSIHRKKHHESSALDSNERNSGSIGDDENISDLGTDEYDGNIISDVEGATDDDEEDDLVEHSHDEDDTKIDARSDINKKYESNSSYDHEFRSKDTATKLDNSPEAVIKSVVSGSAGVAPGTIEAGKKVLGNVDPHDLLKLQRWRRKNDSNARKPKSYVKGKVIDGEHELYTLSIAVMIGVRQSISRTNVELTRGAGKRWVRIQDFRATEKYEFRPKGDGQTPPHLLAHTFKFKDYSPIVFAYLRRMYGVNEFDFLLSVCGNANFIEFISNAKSGQFFFYSSDGRYMIKTMTNAESKFLRRVLPQYFKHCCENPNTMMTRFFGMYRVKLYHLRRNVKFVIMNSVYYTDKHLQLFYDLKGSTLGRDAKPGQAVLKDNDLRKSLPDGALALKSEQRKFVKKQIEKDCEFLQSVEIMDYSMLVGVHFVPPTKASRTPIHTNRSPTKHTKAIVSLGDEFVVDSTPFGSRSPLRGDSDLFVRPENELQNNNARHRRCSSLHNHSFDDGLDDDDNSYLIGSNYRPINVTSSNVSSSEETEHKKLATVEKLYWPFHRLFDIHGYRRLHPLEPPHCDFSEEDEKILKGYKIPKFVPPSSDRKDGGFEMDTSGLKLPLSVIAPSGTEQICHGKIFYMGIIDILQEYNARKSLETTYRSIFSGRTGQVSCIPPRSYGERFCSFFEEFTNRENPADKQKKVSNESTEILALGERTEI